MADSLATEPPTRAIDANKMPLTRDVIETRSTLTNNLNLRVQLESNWSTRGHRTLPIAFGRGSDRSCSYCWTGAAGGSGIICRPPVLFADIISASTQARLITGARLPSNLNW